MNAYEERYEYNKTAASTSRSEKVHLHASLEDDFRRLVLYVTLIKLTQIALLFHDENLTPSP